MASMSFDVLLATWCALTNGGMLVVCPGEALADPPAIYALLAQNRITILELTPSLILPLTEYVHRHGLPLDFLKVLIVGSEAIAGHHFETLQKRFGKQLRLINSYGLTEATIDLSFFEADPAGVLNQTASTPIGKPLRNVQLHV